MSRCARPLPCLLLLLLLVQAASVVQGVISSDSQPSSSGRSLAQNSKSWQTLNGSVPLVIARGGSSWLFPEQTFPAYLYALNNSLSSIALLCDLQLSKDGVGLCRTGLDLSNSTNINQAFPNGSNQYVVNGINTSGFFSIDFTAAQIFSLAAVQPIQSRTNVYDDVYGLLQPENVTSIAEHFGSLSLFWLNIQYPSFFKEHKLDMASYVLSAMKTLTIDYISSPEVAFLKSINTGAPKSKTKLIFEFLDEGELEPSTNVTYGSLLKNLKVIKSFAAGILVPKSFIWPVNIKSLYLESQTMVVQEAHKAGLEVYASGFVNDAALPVYNYSFDPIQEYLQFISSSGPVVDGVMTDFPTTASEALACYSSSSQVASSKLVSKANSPLVISHNGASGDYPGCTLLSYTAAIKDGVDYIDCPIQMTKDGVPICRESPDLLKSTDISMHPDFFSRTSTIPQFQSTKGIFTVNMTMKEINTLKAIIYSPEQGFGILRNPAFDYSQNISTLSDFLTFASKEASSKVGILIDIQNAYFLETALHLDVVGSVISALDAAGYKKSDQVLIQSEDSAVLQRFQQLTTYKLVYHVLDAVTISTSAVQQIKQVAGIVTLPRAVVADAYSVGFLANSSNVVEEFKAQNMTVFVSYLRNEFVALAIDYEADPTLEINTIVQFFKVDGIMTDFPATARAYLDNDCLTLGTEASTLAYSLHLVIPGALVTQTLPPNDVPALSPLPALSVPEAALPPSLATAPSPGLSSGSPLQKSPTSAPSKPSTGSQMSPHLFLTISTVLVTLLYFLAQ